MHNFGRELATIAVSSDITGKEFRSNVGLRGSNLKSPKAKYGSVSEKLTKILESLEKESADIRGDIARKEGKRRQGCASCSLSNWASKEMHSIVHP
jgi:hypothetical protein